MSTEQQRSSPAAKVEIERKYLLDSLPEMPSHAAAYHLEQGYLNTNEASLPEGESSGQIAEGRIRRTTAPDGEVLCTHTIKHGRSVKRTEIERTIAIDEFEKCWPGTEGRRVRKTRYRVEDNSSGAPLVWEIDVFDDMDLVLAEVELPSVDAEVVFPSWLAGHVVREVTDDDAYRNYSLAVRGRPAS